MSQSTSRLPDLWIEKIFDRLSCLYGASFTSKWTGIDSKSIKDTWADVLAGVSGEQIKAALIECGKTCKYPPSAPEFYMLCKQQRVEPCHVALLSKPIVKQADGYERIQKIKQDLAKSKTVGE